MKQKRKRSIASYRAASLKGARTRKRMRGSRPLWVNQLYAMADSDGIIRAKTIDRLPKVQWP